MIFNLENLFCDIISENTLNDAFFSTTNYCLIFINTFKDKTDIDLDLRNVKNIALKIIHILEDVQEINAIKRFLNIPLKRNNPYITKKEKEESMITIFGDYKLKKNLLLSEYFFSFSFIETWPNSGLLLIVLFIFDFFSIIGFAILFFINIRRVIMIIIAIYFNIFIIFKYFCGL